MNLMKFGTLLDETPNYPGVKIRFKLNTLCHDHSLYRNADFCEIQSTGGATTHILISICLHLLKFHLACATKWLPPANHS